MADQNAAWRQKILGIELKDKAKAESRRDASQQAMEEGFNDAFGYGDKHKKKQGLNPLGAAPVALA